MSLCLPIAVFERTLHSCNLLQKMLKNTKHLLILLLVPSAPSAPFCGSYKFGARPPFSLQIPGFPFISQFIPDSSSQFTSSAVAVAGRHARLMSTSCDLWSVRSVRLRVAVAIALALTIEGLMRSNLNMVSFIESPPPNLSFQAIVCMLNSTALTDGKPMIPSNTSSDRSTPSCPMLQIGQADKVEHVSKLEGTSAGAVWSDQIRHK